MRPFALSLLPIVIFVLQCTLTAAVKEKPTSLQIGVKHRVPDSECHEKTGPGDELAMDYTGWLWTPQGRGEEFDSSIPRKQPFKFTLGQGQVIKDKGWDQGLLDMCVGEKRRLVIPAELGYGSRGAGGKIPPDSALIFDVECLKIHKKYGKEL